MTSTNLWAIWNNIAADVAAFDTNDIEVSARWQTPTGPVVHTFTGFWEAAEEQAMSRIWGGIHYRFDQEAGQEVGRRVGRFVLANYVRPLNHWDDDDHDRDDR